MTTLAASAPSTSKRTQLSAGWWPERTAALLSITGVLIAIFLGFHVYAWQQSGSDFKTMYGSAASLAHGLNAYNFANIASVFHRNAVVEPASWYGHAPVYPPFTLALLTPFAALPMALAVYAWVIFSGIVFAFALASLARYSGEHFGLTRPWRLLLIALASASPLLAFALEMGNVSVVVTALCLLAVVLPETSSTWTGAAAIAFGLLLKPHLALWVALALLFMHGRSRSIALRAFGVAAAIASLLSAAMALTHNLVPQLSGYFAMLHAEVGGGSMDARRHDLVGVAAQITSLDSLTGFWSPHLHLVDVALLVAAFLALGAASLRLRTPNPSLKLALVAALSCFGLLATYHRAHDGIILIVLLPWVIATLRESWRDARAWMVLVLSIALSCGPAWSTWQWLATKPSIGPLAELMLYRQVPIAALLLATLLFHKVLHSAFAHPAPARQTAAGLRAIRV